MQRRITTPLPGAIASYRLPTGPSIMTRMASTVILASVWIVGCGPSSSAGRTNHTTQVQPEVAGFALRTVDPPAATKPDAAAWKAENITQQGDAKAVPKTADADRDSAPERSPMRRAGTGGTIDITFDDLKLDMPVGTLFDRVMLTPRIEELDGKNVRLRGFIFAGGVFQSTGIKSFPFVMNTQCKFGPQGLAYCVILVELDEGVTTNFTTYPITVEGKLSIRPFNASGFTWSVYHMRGRKVF